MKRIWIYGLLMLSGGQLNAQKNCAKPDPGYVPLNEPGNWNFQGYTGGMYGAGSRVKSGSHLADGLKAAAEVVPLDTQGNPAKAGKIVMIGVGASNPRTEFNAFMAFADTFTRKNPALSMVNTCIGGQGIQKMKSAGDNYWKIAAKTLDSLGLNARQVQVAWIETDNTANGDTAFPKAPLALTAEYRELLITLKSLYPNLKLCYFAGRAYSGWAEPQAGGVGKGLLAPRDYLHGWATRFLIEKQVNREAGYISSGTGATIPFSTWANYSYTNGSSKRSDGFQLDCATDVGPDGLHLTAAGEQKIGLEIFRYFAADTTTKPWFLKQDMKLSVAEPLQTAELQIFPNPSSGQVSIHVPELRQPMLVEVFNLQGMKLRTVQCGSNSITLDTGLWSDGCYLVRMTAAGTVPATARLLVKH